MIFYIVHINLLVVLTICVNAIILKKSTSRSIAGACFWMVPHMGCSCSPTSLTADTCNAALGVNQSCAGYIYLNASRTRRGTQGDTAAFTHNTALCFCALQYPLLFIKCHSQWTKHDYCMFAEQIELLTLEIIRDLYLL
jgi:hypothetical protein